MCSVSMSTCNGTAILSALADRIGRLVEDGNRALAVGTVSSTNMHALVQHHHMYKPKLR